MARPDDCTFGSFANLAQIDLAASSALTRRQLGWNPTGPGLLTDLRNMDLQCGLGSSKAHRAWRISMSA